MGISAPKEDLANLFENPELEALNNSLQVGAERKESYVEHKSRKYGFLLGEEKFFFDEEVKREFFEKIVIKKIPLMDEFILGLCNVRGNLIPVYDLPKKYSGQSKISNPNKLKVLVVSDGVDMVGIAMNETLQAIDFYKENLQEVTTDVHENISSLIGKSYSINNETWHQIDHDRLFESLTFME